MKKFMAIVLASVGVVLLSVASSLGVYYYTDRYCGITDEDAEIGAQIETAVAQVTNPTFTSIDDVCQFHRQQVQQKTIDSTFTSIPVATLMNISQVLIGRDGFVTKEDVVREFQRHYEPIYKYIDPDTQPKELQPEKPSSVVECPVDVKHSGPDTIVVR
jgi:hypothetical protein